VTQASVSLLVAIAVISEDYREIRHLRRRHAGRGGLERVPQTSQGLRRQQAVRVIEKLRGLATYDGAAGCAISLAPPGRANVCLSIDLLKDQQMRGDIAVEPVPGAA